MAWGNERKDYGTTSGRTGFYACHSPNQIREEELKKVKEMIGEEVNPEGKEYENNE